MEHTYQVSFRGWPVSASVTWLDDGVDIGLYGGIRRHVGTVVSAAPGRESMSLRMGDELNAALAYRWAEMLLLRWGCPVCVRCGIEYPGLDEDGTGELRSVCMELLMVVMNEEGVSDGCP